MTYEVLCSPENLDLAFKKARKGKTLKPYVIAFEKDLQENLHKLRMDKNAIIIGLHIYMIKEALYRCLCCMYLEC